jgi:hypothetical protein
MIVCDSPARTEALHATAGLLSSQRPGSLAMLVGLLIVAGSMLRPAVGAAQTTSPHRVVVPLSDPGRPATVHVGLLSGSIRVSGWNGKEVVVDARPRDGEGGDEDWDEDHKSKDGDSRGLRKVPNLGAGLTIDENNNVVEIGASSFNRSLDVVLQVPSGTKLELSTVNDGDLVINDVNGEVNAQNTNGDITITGIIGPAVVHALNGEIVARFKRVDPKNPSAFSSLNGNIDVTLPADTRANLRVKSDNGEIYTDFDVKWGSRPVVDEDADGDSDSKSDRKSKSKKSYGFNTSMVGEVNGGGPNIRFQTFNGNIYIRKAK